jgi:hypothetical protein
MSKYIPINTADPEFLSLMQNIAKAIRTGNTKLAEETKKKFAEADFTVFYNAETEEIRVIRKDCPPIDFKADRFTDIASKGTKVKEVK